jgi:hypothetical protein
MSENEQKASQQPCKIWLLDEPSRALSSKAEWEEYLAMIRALAAEHGLTPQLEDVIATAEAVIKDASASGLPSDTG